MSPFLTRILEQYCNLRYGTAFANTPIVCSPAYDIEAMMEKYPPLTATESTMQRDVVQTYEGQDAPHPGAADQAEPCGQGSGERRQALLQRWPVC